MSSNPTPSLADQSQLVSTSPMPGFGAGSESRRGKDRDPVDIVELVQIRLGIASGLFAALRAKHAATASHSLRVALGCSSWAIHMDLPSEQRDEIEVAALLHDIGKIGVPDSILRKPGALSKDEANLMHQRRRVGLEIIAVCSASNKILEIIEHSSAWFNGSRSGFQFSGDEIPLGARMIAIVDAYDAMTTDQLYRKALPQERVIAELFEFSGSQFDPALVHQFAQLCSNDQIRLDPVVASRWLQHLKPEDANSFWQLQLHDDDNQPDACPAVTSLFHRKLVENMLDAVVFIDESLRILYWSPGAERLTGISAASVCDRQWAPHLVNLCDPEGHKIGQSDCPVTYTLRSASQMFQRFNVRGRRGELVAVDVNAIPIVSSQGTTHGVTFVMHDVSSEKTLQERVQSLHRRATRDPLTQVANRAEFDRVHAELARTHLAQSIPYSLIVADIDRFKMINDKHGHQAGDEALVHFAALLQRSCRKGDLVARYGGEEFAIVSADCGSASATDLAEQIRRELARMPIASLGGRCITSSFGVTEVQPGDTPETMLRRADRALYQAKENGRNQVVQLGAGMGEGADAEQNTGWWQSWRQRRSNSNLVDRWLITNVPLNIAAEKLRGFVADHKAEIVSVENEQVVLKVNAKDTPVQRRKSDRPVSIIIELELAERRIDRDEGVEKPDAPLRTTVHVVMNARRHRDRRRSASESARQLLSSLRSYLMAHECAIDPKIPTGTAGLGA